MAVFLDPPVDISLTSFAAWTDIDVSTQPGYTSNVVGVLVEVVLNFATDRGFGLRKNSSTDNRTTALWAGIIGNHFVAAIGVDSSGIFEGYAENGEVDFFLVGFLTSDDAAFFVNAVDKSTGTSSSWVDLDVSADVGSDPVKGVWLEMTAPAVRIASVRMNGSTDDRRSNHPGFHSWLYCGVDASKLCEQWINATDVDLYLVGYQKANTTYNTNAIDRSTGTTGSYVDVTALPAGAIGGIYEATTSSGAKYNLRKKGSSHDRYFYLQTHQWFVVACDASQLVQQKIDSTSVDIYEVGYFTPPPAAGDLTWLPSQQTALGVSGGMISSGMTPPGGGV